MGQGPTEPRAGCSTFLLSSGGAGGGYYRGALDMGPIPTENLFPWQTLVACLVKPHLTQPLTVLPLRVWEATWPSCHGT